MRLRLRLQGEGDLGAGFTVGARLSTAPNFDDPNSPYHDLGQGLREARFVVDRIFARWTAPLDMPLHVWGGKYPNQFRMPTVYSELVWDADLQPEGLAATFDPIPELRLVGGAHVLLTRASGNDVNYGTLQASVRIVQIEDWRFDASFGGYFYNEFGEAGAVLVRDNQGNALEIDEATGDTLGFASEFAVLQGHASIDYTGLPVRLRAAGEFFGNPRAADGFDDTGWALGAEIGALGSAGDWRLEYRYQWVGQESMFSPVAQDDFLDATNFQGHLVGAAWQFLDFSRVRAWGLWSRRLEPEDDGWQKRFRVDLDFFWRLQW